VNNHRFAAVFVAVTLLTAWAWGLAQDLGVPWPLRVVGGVASALLLNRWLVNRLDRSNTPPRTLR
jgi:hypothetical protein